VNYETAYELSMSHC